MLINGHVAFNNGLRQGRAGPWALLGLGLPDGSSCELRCFGAVARGLAGLRPGTGIEVEVSRSETRRWVGADGSPRTVTQHVASAVRVVELPDPVGYLRRIGAACTAEAILTAGPGPGPGPGEAVQPRKAAPSGVRAGRVRAVRGSR